MIRKYYTLYKYSYNVNKYFFKNQIIKLCLIILKIYYSFIINRVFYIVKAIKNRHILMSIYLYFNINFIYKLT